MNFPPRAGRVSGRATPSLRHAPRAKLQRTDPGSSPLNLRGILFKRSGPALYSDLLLSIAVAQWSKLDARQEIHGLVDEVDRIGSGFNFSKDFVLKAGLMLADIASVGFKVENFNHANMGTLEQVWA